MAKAEIDIGYYHKVKCMRWLILASSLTFGIALSGAACQTQVPEIKISGKSYRPQPTEYNKVSAARAAQKVGKIEDERQSWFALLREYPQSPFVPEARYRLGWLAYSQKRWQEAVSYLQQAVTGLNEDLKRHDALWAYGESLFHLQRYNEALQSIEEIYDKLNQSRQKKARTMLLKSARESKRLDSEIRWLAESLPHLPPQERKVVERHFYSVIDGKLSLKSLQSIYLRRGEQLRFPYTLIALRLARYYCHVRDWKHCSTLVRQMMEEIPPTDSMFPQVREMHTQMQVLQGNAEPYVIGVIYPKTGRGGGIGRWVKNAINLAAKNYPQIRLVWIDSQSRSDIAAKAVDKLVFKHRAIAIFGPILPESAAAAALRAERLGVPMITISIREGLPQMGAYIFRNNLTLSQVGRAMARYAFEQLGLRKYAVLYPQRASGQIQAAAFWQEIERLGGQIVGAEAYSPSTTDFTDEAKKLVGRFHLIHRPLWSQLYRQISHVSSALERNRLYKKLVNQFLPVTDFDALFIPVEIYNQVAMITSAIAQQDVEVKLHYRYWERQREELYQRRNRPIKFIQLLGTNVWYNEQLFKLEPRNVIGSIFCLRYFPQSNRKIVKQFVNMYKKSYPEQTQGQDPIHVSAYTYDSMQMLLHIVHDKNPPKTREEFRFRLLQIKNFAGVTGDMSVQPDGEILAPIKYLIADRKQFFRLHYVSKDLIR